MTQSIKGGSLFKGILLVAGTSIGGGMLALPVLTSLSGFLPSLAVYFLCWLFMSSTGLLFLEVSLALPEGANIISMSEKTLGRAGKAFSWVMYLFLFYCLSLAYTVGCGALVSEFFPALPKVYGPLFFVLLFSPFVFAGTKVVGKVNLGLMLGLCLSFLAFVFLGFKFIDPKMLAYRNWNYVFMAFPIAFTSFAYQGIIPTLVSYLDRDIARIRKAILLGSFIPLVTYIIWQALIQGIVPIEGPNGLLQALAHQQDAVTPLKNFIDASLVSHLGQYFAFFALVTSFFGVTLGLLDFLADGLNIKKTPIGKVWLCALIFVPSLLLSYTHPHLFLTALSYAGGYGCALLLGALPIAMVWALRYKHALSSPYTFPGGKRALIALFSFVIFELFCQIFLSVQGI